MIAFDLFMSKFGWPLSMATLCIATFIVYRKTRCLGAFVQSIGFLISFVANLMVNHGPREITYTGTGAEIMFTHLFSMGWTIGPIGTFLAALGSLIFAWRLRSSHAQFPENIQPTARNISDTDVAAH